jgi:hypothetical protein
MFIALIDLLPALLAMTSFAVSVQASDGHDLGISWGDQVLLAGIRWKTANVAEVDTSVRLGIKGGYTEYSGPSTLEGITFPTPGPKRIALGQGLTRGIHHSEDGTLIPEYILEVGLLFQALGSDSGSLKYWHVSEIQSTQISIGIPESTMADFISAISVDSILMSSPLSPLRLVTGSSTLIQDPPHRNYPLLILTLT